jgi:sterol desaturase/sphingolipid hydroxylase (fatty acid hydroxylase superfamily)
MFEQLISNIIFSTRLFLGIFSASTLTAYSLCWYTKEPFFNPAHNNATFLSRLKKVSSTTTLILCKSIFVDALLLNRFIENVPHTIMGTTYNLFMYSTLAEFFYYIYHITVHTKKYYKLIHAQHHESVYVYPFDTYYIGVYDSYFLLASLSLPIFFLKMNYFEYTLCLYFYITADYIAHSRILFDHHVIHHKLLLYNYCIMNPIFDILLGSYK